MLHEQCFQSVMMIGNSKLPKEIAIKAQELIKKINTNSSDNIKRDLKNALKEYLNVFWFFKDKRVEISKYMHYFGSILATQFGCKYKWDEKEEYYTDCPNILLHMDFGFSLRGFEKYACSICGKDFLECKHITGEFYNGKECFYIVKDLDLVTFDLVKEPEMVYTRVTKIPYDKEFILDQIKNDVDIDSFEYGKSDLYCHHCLSCKGYNPDKNNKLLDKEIDED